MLARAARNLMMIVLTDTLIEMTRHIVEPVGYLPNRYVMPSLRRLLVYLHAGDGNAAAAEMASMLKRLQRFHLSQADAPRKAR